MRILLNAILIPGLFLSVAVAMADETITLQYNFKTPRLDADGRDFRVSMGDLPSMRKAGQPVLPYKPVRVLIPRGKSVLDVEIEEGEKVSLKGSYRVRPAQQPLPLSYQGSPIAASPSKAIYSSLAPFPPVVRSAVSIQKKDPFQVLLFNINPVSYIPAKGEISYFKSITVKVRLKSSAERLMRGLTRRMNLADEESIRRKVENPEALSSYQYGEMGGSSGGGGEGGFPEGGASGDYPHLIITNQALSEASGDFTFPDLVNHRTVRGMNSTIVTTEYIYASFDGTRPDGDIDNQTRIRNFIGWARENWGTEYVLLGGNSGIIPIRYLNADGTDIPADMYYGNLDGTFDDDADGIYGEPTDGVDGGEVDLYADVYIGRACVENGTDVVNFVRKTIAYEESLVEEAQQAYLVGEHLGFGGASEYAKPSLEEIRLGSSAHGYTTKGFTEDEFFQTATLYDADGTWDKSQFISLINSGVCILNGLGHANYLYDMKLTTSDLASLTNTDYFFMYSQGCKPGGFDIADCFAEVATTMEKGAFAVVMNARYGWARSDSTAGPSQYYDREFWDALFGEGIGILGRMNADSKEDNDLRINDDRMRWCFYELNLFGDPATEIRGITSDGTVSFSAVAYPIPGAAVVTVMDLDLDADPNTPDTITVEVISDTEEIPETLLLTETGDSTKTFQGSISIMEGDSVQGDGVLQVNHGDIVTVTYIDEHDGGGEEGIGITDEAVADGQPPDIAAVGVWDIAPHSATITWTTDEPTTGEIRYGTNHESLTEVHEDSTLASDHSPAISGLSVATRYYFEITAMDTAGYETTDDNGGVYYVFTTAESDGSPVDTDGDGTSDNDDADDDGDGLDDLQELVDYATDPIDSDTDGDGLNDGDEVNHGTDPLEADTDGDGFFDGHEMDEGSDPLEGGSRPPVMVLLRESSGGDQNVFLYDVSKSGDWTYSDSSSRNNSPLGRDLWVVPSGNDVVDLVLADIDGDSYDELVVVRESKGDQNLYIYNVPLPGDMTYWDAYARNPSPVARDWWLIPSGNSIVGLANAGDIDGDSYDELAVVKESKGDQNLYIYNMPLLGDMTYWNAASRNPSPLARDLWCIPRANNVASISGADTDGDNDNDHIVCIRREGEDQNLYLYTIPAPGDWSWDDAAARQDGLGGAGTTLATDNWVIVSGNSIISMGCMDVDDGAAGDEVCVMKDENGDHNFYVYALPVPGDSTYWDAASRNPSCLARDLWVIPVGNSTASLTTE